MLRKIAHNSTIPALAGNRDLKALQNLIAAEKAVLISLQKLSVDYSKASEALRTWGLTEGDYLGGILSASTSILHHFSSALSQYAAHGHSMRDQLKAIRTREESLDDLERRRRSIQRKAEDAEKKLSKMSPDSKYFSMQSDTLNRLRDDIQTLDSDIITEEAALDKFKRSATKVWMGIKFGGLVECCQKGTIAGELGRLAIAEISEEMVQPGLPRHFTFPRNKIEYFVAEAYRRVNMITLSTFPSEELLDRDQHDPTFPDAPAFHISAPTEHGKSFNNRFSMSGELQSPPTSNNESRRVSAEQPPPQTSTTNDGDGNSYFPQGSSLFQTFLSSQQGGDIDNVRSTGSQYQQQPSQRYSQTLPSSQQPGANERDLDEFGVTPRSSPPYQQQFRSIGSLHPQQSSQGPINPPFSQTLSPSQQGIMDDSANVRSTSPPYQQQFSQGNYNPSFSQTLPSSQLHQVDEDSFNASTPSTAPPYQQQFSRETANPPFSQTLPASQPGTMDDSANIRSASPPHQQQFSQTLLSSQLHQVNEDDFNANTLSTAPPYQQRFSQGTTNPSFSQTLPSSRQLGANEDVDDFGVNTHSTGVNVHSTGPPYQQRFSQGSSDASFSQTLPPSHQVNEGASDNFSHNVRPAAPPYEQQQFSQGSVNSSFSQTSPPYQQPRVNEGTVDVIGPNVHSPHPQRFTQGIVNSSFSQTLPPSQQPRDSEGIVGSNARSTVSPHPQQFSHGTVGPLFSQTLPPSQQIGANETAVSSNVRPTTLTQQRSVSPLFSRRSPPSQQPRVKEDDFGANVHSTGSLHSQQVSQGTVTPLFSPVSSPYQGIREDKFGSNDRSTGPVDSSSTSGGQIATFQVQKRPAGSTGGYSLQDLSSSGPPMGDTSPTDDSSFSASVANALQDIFVDPPGTKISPWVNNQLYDNSEGIARRPYNQPANSGSGRSDSPLPVTSPSHKRRNSSGLANQWTSLEGPSTLSSLSSQSSEYHGSLIAPVGDESKNGEMTPQTAVPFSIPPATAMTTAITDLSDQNTNEENNRHVRFDGVEDVDREIEKRVSLEKEQRAIVLPLFQNSSSSITNPLPPPQFQTSQVSAPERF